MLSVQRHATLISTMEEAPNCGRSLAYTASTSFKAERQSNPFITDCPLNHVLFGVSNRCRGQLHDARRSVRDEAAGCQKCSHFPVQKLPLHLGRRLQRETACFKEGLGLLLQVGVGLEPLAVLLHGALPPHLGLDDERHKAPDVVQLLQGVLIAQCSQQNWECPCGHIPSPVPFIPIGPWSPEEANNLVQRRALPLDHVALDLMLRCRGVCGVPMPGPLEGQPSWKPSLWSTVHRRPGLLLCGSPTSHGSWPSSPPLSPVPARESPC